MAGYQPSTLLITNDNHTGQQSHSQKFILGVFIPLSLEPPLTNRHTIDNRHSPMVIAEYHQCLQENITHEFVSITQYNIRSIVNRQNDANRSVDRREKSSLLMSTCTVTRTFNVIQELHFLSTQLIVFTRVDL